VDVELVTASDKKGGFNFYNVPFTATSVGAGRVFVKVNLPKSMKNASLFSFDVKRTVGGETSYGTATVHRTGSRNLGGGQ